MTIPALWFYIGITMAVEAEHSVTGVTTKTGIQALLEFAAILSDVDSIPGANRCIPPRIQDLHVIGAHERCRCDTFGTVNRHRLMDWWWWSFSLPFPENIQHG